MKFLCLCLVPFLAATTIAQQRAPIGQDQLAKPAHDLDFWREIKKNKYSVPPGTPIFPLAKELSADLGSPDPQLRDDLAYSILDAWIVRKPQLSQEQLLSLLDEWESNLRLGIGESETDGVLRRSFSVLCLGTLAERDLKTPFLGESRYRSLLENALNYLRDERDLRGFDSAKGWIHATAHTADLLAVLAANPFFKVEDQRRVLQAIAERLASARLIFSYGEQDRLAGAIEAITTRKDFDAPAFHQWLSALDARDREVWKTSPPNDNHLKTFENNSYLLQSLAARLHAGPKTPATTATLDEVTKLLKERW